MNTRLFAIFLIVTLIVGGIIPNTTFASTLSERLSGRILLQVESYGRAWYVDPVSQQRYYLQNGQVAYDIMRSLGLGISNTDLAKIPTTLNENGDKSLTQRLNGRIVLQVEERGEAWYINPADGLRYYLRDGNEAYRIMRELSLGISNANLTNIPITPDQLVHDTTFNDVAYAKTINGVVTESKNIDQVLPPASMTKIMTALVLLDQPTFNKQQMITIQESHLRYPSDLVGDDRTSELPMTAGDVFTVADLWVAMLVASSNQATIALVDSSGLTRDQFILEMNTKASELNLTHTHFVDPTGLNAHNLTTPRDMAQLGAVAFSHRDIATATQLRNYSMTNLKNGTLVPVTDRNFKLDNIQIDAAKTGYLIEAQRCVVVKQGDTISVVMHARSMIERNNILRSLLN